MYIKAMKNVFWFIGVFIPFFLGGMAQGHAQEASPTDEIVVKATNAVIFAMNANLKLTQDQMDAVRPIITDYIVKVRDLQQSVENGNIDSRAMYTQKQQLTIDEDKQLSEILTSDQMKVWTVMQQDQSV